MIFDVTIIIVLGYYELCPYDGEVNVVCILTGCPPISFPLLRLPYSLRYNNIEIMLINNSKWHLQNSSERKRLLSLGLNQNLEMSPGWYGSVD